MNFKEIFEEKLCSYFKSKDGKYFKVERTGKDMKIINSGDVEVTKEEYEKENNGTI